MNSYLPQSLVWDHITAPRRRGSQGQRGAQRPAPVRDPRPAGRPPAGASGLTMAARPDNYAEFLFRTSSPHEPAAAGRAHGQPVG
jgi:hypothetical protein